jgi:hypothetical protein
MSSERQVPWKRVNSGDSTTPDLHYYTTHFVDGPRADIRAVVTLQHLANLNTVYTLALLQEEVADDAKKCEFHISDHGASTKA